MNDPRIDPFLTMPLPEAGVTFDAYLWRTRDPYKEGVLQSWCEWDTGEDNSARFGGSPTRWPHDYPPDGEHTPDPNDPEDQRRYYLWSHVLKQQVKEPVLVPFRSMDIMAYSYENRAIRALISEELGDGGDFEYVQRFGSTSYALRRRGATFAASINGAEKFRCSVGARVVSDLEGKPVQVVGIDTKVRHVRLTVDGRVMALDLNPNQVTCQE